MPRLALGFELNMTHYGEHFALFLSENPLVIEQIKKEILMLQSNLVGLFELQNPTVDESIIYV